MVKSKEHQAWCLKSLVKRTSCKLFPTHYTQQTLHSVNTWSTLVKNMVHQAWRLKCLVKQTSCTCVLLVVLDRLCTMLHLKHNGEEQGTPSLTLETLGQAGILQSFPTRCTRPTLHSVNTWSTLVNNKVHQAWRLKRLVKQASCSRFLLFVLDRLCTMLHLKHNGEEQGTPSLTLETLGQADILQSFPTRCTRRTLHIVNTWSTMLKNKDH